MLSTTLGVIAALIVIAWGVRWYFKQTARQWPSMLDSATPSEHPSIIDTPLMPRKEAEEFMQREFKEVTLLNEEPEKASNKASGKRSEIVIDSLPSKPTPMLVSPTKAQIKLDVARRNAKDRQGRVMGFCARCREKREVAKPSLTRTKKGKSAIRGQCVECGAGMFIFTLE